MFAVKIAQKGAQYMGVEDLTAGDFVFDVCAVFYLHFSVS